MELSADHPFDFWTDIKEVKVLICLHVIDWGEDEDKNLENMKNLVLVNKEIAEICSSEHFYRLLIIKNFNVDLVGYIKDPIFGPHRWPEIAIGPKYQTAYRKLSLSLARNPEEYWYYKKMIKIGDGKFISWQAFEYACEKGYLPIIKQTSKKTLMDSLITNVEPENMKEYEDEYSGSIDMKEYEDEYSESIDEIGENTCTAKEWDILEILIKEYGLSLESISWNIMYELSSSGDIEGYKRWIKNGLDIRNNPSATALREATKHGYSDLAIFLIENQAAIVPTEYVEDWPPIIYAVKYCSVKVVKMMVERGQDIHWNEDMIFKEDIWKGFDYMERSKPSPEMLVYLSSIQKLSWLEKEDTIA